MPKGNVFTTAAIINIDHNPSSRTAQDSFYGTNMSFQHPRCVASGVEQTPVRILQNHCIYERIFDNLTTSYTDMPPVVLGKRDPVPP